ncbi:hypothetical protein EYF80_013030 [Liparis tanakae]|uniref:Uncharacterized protein n=1 Tax=Liparis tanakae TaxID=230148 RepID=A0A4Z2IG80_9TELE|nr:hypothetical protein EYF80_013030 [Liparis tanakae]
MEPLWAAECILILTHHKEIFRAEAAEHNLSDLPEGPQQGEEVERRYLNLEEWVKPQVIICWAAGQAAEQQGSPTLHSQITTWLLTRLLPRLGGILCFINLLESSPGSSQLSVFGSAHSLCVTPGLQHKSTSSSLISSLCLITVASGVKMSRGDKSQSTKQQQLSGAAEKLGSSMKLQHSRTLLGPGCGSQQWIVTLKSQMERVHPMASRQLVSIDISMSACPTRERGPPPRSPLCCTTTFQQCPTRHTCETVGNMSSMGPTLWYHQLLADFR